MNRVHENIIAFNSKLNELWKSEKYCDLSIKVEDTLFKCHRLVLITACEYFDRMFGGNFRESTETDITLREPDVNAVAMEQILRFVYTGDVALNADNVHSVLRASEFFDLARVEELCVEYIRHNLPISELFEAFVYTCLTKKRSLMDKLSQYIMQHFSDFCNECDFLDLAYEDLLVLLSQHWYLPTENEYHLLAAVIRWLNHAPESRAEYVEVLLEQIEFQYIPVDRMKDLFKKLVRNRMYYISAEHCSAPCSSSVAYRDPPALNTPSIPALGLHMYMEYQDHQTVVLSTHRGAPHWTQTASFAFTCDLLQCIGLENYLYCMYYSSSGSSDTFKFQACSTLDVSPASPYTRFLQLPPAMLKGFDLCNIGNSIYVSSWYDVQLPSPHRTRVSYLNDEEISRGIYVYNVDVDEWFPVPALASKVVNSTMVACDGMLYLLGLESGLGCASVQALDFRMSKWQKIPTSTYKHLNDACCTHEGKIYATSHVSEQTRQIEMYDPMACKWEQVKPLNEILVPFWLVSYENWLWAFGTPFCEPSEPARGPTIEVYNSCTQEWNPSPVDISKILLSNIEDPEAMVFRDAVVFKSF